MTTVFAEAVGGIVLQFIVARDEKEGYWWRDDDGFNDALESIADLLHAHAEDKSLAEFQDAKDQL